MHYISKAKFVQIIRDVSRTEVQYFDFKWLDTASISFLDFFHAFENYRVQRSSTRTFSHGEGSTGHVQVIYGQSRLHYNVEWSITTIDVVLGTVGGFVGLIWGALALLLGGYESFKLENSLIGAVYPTSPQGREDSDSDSDSSDDKNDLSE